MPNLWKFLSKAESGAPEVNVYHFEEAEDLILEPDETELPEEEPEPSDPRETEIEDVYEGSEPKNPVNYAQLQSEQILKDAERRADEIILQAEKRAEQYVEEVREKAVEEGYQAGYHEGIRRGMVKAQEESVQAREALARRLEEDVAAFIAKAERALDQQMDENMDDLRDLALAVAEKVVCVSLKSSSEVIGRMIQSAVDKRKRRDWAHIYIAECDAKRLTSIPASLTAALSELSDRVRIIPMSDDEAGTCIIECPDEIIDASAATQLQNIRDLLSNGSPSGVVANFNFTER